jgi:ABC-2 type transport system permease protein
MVWTVVAARELRDLWLAGRALPLLLVHCVLLSAIFYLAATNQAMNFLEQREATGLTLQVAVAVGALLVLLAAADAVSGERERGTLETLVLTPAPRRALLLGKGVAALSLWLAAWALAIPYLWFLGRDVGADGPAILAGLLVGSLLAFFVCGYGLVISVLTGSNRLSLSLGLIGLLALFAPTQLPTGARAGWAGELLLRVDPFTAALHYLGEVIVNAHPPGDDLGWLISPAIGAAAGIAASLAVGSRLSLTPGLRS